MKNSPVFGWFLSSYENGVSPEQLANDIVAGLQAREFSVRVGVSSSWIYDKDTILNICLFASIINSAAIVLPPLFEVALFAFAVCVALSVNFWWNEATSPPVKSNDVNAYTALFKDACQDGRGYRPFDKSLPCRECEDGYLFDATSQACVDASLFSTVAAPAVDPPPTSDGPVQWASCDGGAGYQRVGGTGACFPCSDGARFDETSQGCVLADGSLVSGPGSDASSSGTMKPWQKGLLAVGLIAGVAGIGYVATRPRPLALRERNP